MANLAHLTVSPEGVAFNPATGDTFMVNKAGQLILKVLQGGGDRDEAVRTLTDTYEVTAEQAQRDVVDFQGRLRSFGLL
jgi:hypothetical protein